MHDLSAKLFTLCASTTPLYASIGGRIFNTIAPEEATLPYVVFSMVSSVPVYTFTEELDHVLIQFSIFSEDPNSAAEVEAIFENLISLYDNTTFTLTNGTVVVMTRTNASLMASNETTDNGSGKGWQYDVDYEVIVSKT